MKISFLEGDTETTVFELFQKVLLGVSLVPEDAEKHRYYSTYGHLVTNWFQQSLADRTAHLEELKKQMQIHHGYENQPVPEPVLPVRSRVNLSLKDDFSCKCPDTETPCPHAAPTYSVPFTVPPQFGPIHDTDQLLLNMSIQELQQILPGDSTLSLQRLRELQRMAQGNKQAKSDNTFHSNYQTWLTVNLPFY